MRAFGIAMLLLQAVSIGAQAEPIPAEMLSADERTCVAACTQQGIPLARCTPYCDCTFKKVGGQFTLQEYTAGKTAAEQDQPPPKGLIDRMTKISQSCVAETD
jgi:hypothetical protein